ncbi:glycosyl hydrolase 115 family protein [Paenibacillus jamilae]|uniref:glycosyl hydrolase 115 family protein n=1 Tax=Paenibacillus jamilae TaxID=114136 RepID=UPI003D281483
MNNKKQYSREATVLVQKGKAIPIYIDAKGKDYDGIWRVSLSLAKDIELVTAVLPELITDKAHLSGIAVIVGSVGNNDIIDSLIAEYRLDVSDLRNRREAYMIRVLERPCPELDKAIVIVGSDKRGTLYGLYHISELIGVSPWVYWADVHPPRRQELVFAKEQLEYTSKEPSIRYRGFFLNDEWPSLGSWSRNHYGGFNEGMYEKIFELLLRLKGNYLWPAMWSAVFSEDGKSHPLANAELAEAYGIVMGTSHHEPMFRAGEEWRKINQHYGDSGLWDYWANTEAITKFWEDGVIRNKHLSNIITLGMRGEQDSALGGTLEQNIQRLKDIILTQKALLHKHGLDNAPQALTIYKEVETFWHGTDTVQGLKHWEVLDDVTIILSDDNFGNMRKLPEAPERTRKAGWGMYYHFDYHGGPRSYEWVNTVPLEKTWEQMSLAYDYGIRDLWIVNVGDLKPMELPISYFMELAYDFETWGTGNPNRTEEFLQTWTERQFGHAADEETTEGIARVLADYTKMNGCRKPEVTYADTYSLLHYNEAQRVLEKAIRLEKDAQTYYELVQKEQKDAYYQLVYYPAVASANVTKMQIYASLNHKYSGFQPQSVLANHFAALVEESIAKDIQMQEDYNNKISCGKWEGMMSSAHIGYVNWNDEGWQYPEFKYIEPKEKAMMIVDVEGTDGGFTAGTVALPPFTSLQKECYRITVSNAGKQAFAFHLETDADWIKTDPTHGSVLTGETIEVQVDWGRLNVSATGRIIIVCGDQTVKVTVIAEVVHTDNLPVLTFAEAHGVIAIEAEHTCGREVAGEVHWEIIKGYGRSLSSIKLFPTTALFERIEDAPYLEYRICTAEEQIYTLTVYTAPTNPLGEGRRLKYAVAFDGHQPVLADMLPLEFAAGESRHWSESVMNNIHTSTTQHPLAAGMHTLRLYVLDAGLVLQKLVLSHEPLLCSYFGPEESFCKED